MKFKVDENLPAEIAELVRTRGHEADTVTDEGLTGASDPVILERVRLEGRVLFTMDKGIGDIRAYPPGQYAGIVLLRPRTAGRDATLALFRRHLAMLLSVDLNGRLVVVSEAGMRIR